MLSYRKTKNGKWAVMGPANVVTAGATVTVTKRDGTTKTERIGTVGKPFTVDGQQMVYGYPAAAKTTSRTGRRYACDECGDVVTAGEGSCWETGLPH